MNFTTNNDKWYVTNCDDVVIWSGGVDSTVVLYELLLDSSFNKPIGALSVNHFFLHGGKIKGESSTRKNFIDNFVTKNGYNLIYDEIGFKGGSQATVYNEMIQPTSWLTLIHSLVHKNATIHWGCLRTDSHIKYMDRFHELIAVLNRISDKNVKLQIPLMNYTKFYSLEKLFRYKLENYVWVCEIPSEDKDKVTQCGGTVCNSCKAHIQALLQLRMKYNNNKDMKARIDKHLEDTFKIKFKSFQQFSYLYENEFFL